MAAVGVGRIEEAKAILVVTIEQQRDKRTGAEASLIGLPTAADGAGAHGQTAGADAGAAKDYLIVRAVFAVGSGYGEAGGAGGLAGDPCSSQARGGAAKEISAEHGGLLCQTGYARHRPYA